MLDRLLGSLQRALPRRRLARSISAVLVFTLIQSIVGLLPTAYATGTPTVSVPANGWVIPASTNTTISGISVGGLTSGTYLVTVALGGTYTGSTLTISTTTGLTASYGYSSFSGFTKISFTGTQADVNAALATLQFNAGAALTSGTTPTVSVSAVENITGVAFNPANNHYYKAYTYGSTGVVVGTDITDRQQSTALTYAGTQSFAGLNGYLVTITSSDEDNFISTKIASAQNIWIGAKDNWSGSQSLTTYTFGEGYWGWASPGSPEFGAGFSYDNTSVTVDATTKRFVSTTRVITTSYTGTNAQINTTGAGGGTTGYMNWCANEPNNAYNNVGEHSAVTNWSGGTCWNDLHDSNNASVNGFVVEFGTSATDGGFTNAVTSSAKVYIGPKLTAGTGNNQSAQVGTAVAITPTVTLTDSMGTAIPGKSITFSALAGTVDSATPASNASGVVSPVAWRMPNRTGMDTLTATLSGATNSPITFAAYVYAAPTGDTDTALSFNGTSQYASVSDNASADVANAITIEAWVYLESITAGSWNMVVNKEYEYELGVSTTGYWAYGLNGTANGWNGLSTTVPAVIKEWHHIALTRALNTATITFYLDGINVYSGTADNASTGALYNSTNPLTVGARSTDGSTFTAFLNGKVDHVMVFGTDRTQTQIQSDMTSYSPSSTTNLQLYYDFNETSGTKVYNRVAAPVGAADLTVAGSPTWPDVKITDTTTAPAYTIVKFPRTYINASGGWKVPANVSRASILVVAGGGGGGSRHAGGGGAGGLAFGGSYPLSTGQTFQVVVGGGGAGYGNFGNSAYVNGSGVLQESKAGPGGGVGAQGSNSIFKLTSSSTESITALGGGGGSGSGSAGAGGSGGGSNQSVTPGTATQYSGSNWVGYGNSGGQGSSGTCSSDWCGGGGGGAGEVGQNARAVTNKPGDGGAGRSYDISGTSTWYAGGGGGGSKDGTSTGLGGNGGGGNGGNAAIGQNATYGTGGGGGGGGFSGGTDYRGGNGATGVVIIRWITALKPTFTPPATAYLDVGQTETFTVNVASDSATVNLIRTFKWESSTTGASGTFTKIKEGTGAANAFFSWIPTDTSTSGANFVYRVTVTDSDTAGLFISESATAYAIINRAMVITPGSGSTTIAKTINVSRDEPFTITLGTPTYSASLSPVIAGITLETTTATTLNLKIGETVTVGTYYETITVIDSVSATITLPLTLIVAAPPNFLSTGEIRQDNLVFNFDAGNSASYSIANKTLSDISGANRTLTANGTVSPTYSSDNFGSLQLSPASTQYISATGLAQMNTWTVESYVRLDANPNNTDGACIATPTASLGTHALNYALCVDASGTVWSGYRNGTGFRFARTTETLTVGTWVHVVGVFDGTNTAVYFNAVNKGSNTGNTSGGTPSTAPASTNNTLWIGRYFDSGKSKYLPATIGFIRIYNVGFTSTQITNAFNNSKTRFTSANLSALTPSYKYGNSLSETFTATSGYGATTIAPSVGDKQGLTWDLSTTSKVTFNAGQDLSSGYSYDTITVTDSLGASTYLPLRISVTKADTLTIYLDTNTVMTYNGKPATVLPSIQYSGLAGIDSFSTRRLFTSSTYAETATVPTNADTYTVRAETATFAVGDATNYINVVYETRTSTINKAKQSPLNIFLYGGTVGSGFAIQLMGGNGDGVVTETLTGISSVTGCSISNHFLYASEQKQGYCEVRVVKEASQNYLSESSTVQMYFMAFVNSQPTGQMGSGSTIALNGSTSFTIDTTAPPTITGLSWIDGYSTVDMNTGQFRFIPSHWELNGSGFGSAYNTNTVVKFWRNKEQVSGAANSGQFVSSDTSIWFTSYPSGVTPGRIVVITPNGQAVSSFNFTPPTP